MSAGDLTADAYEVPYLPFVDAENSDPALFPDYVRPYLELNELLAVPGPTELDTPLSILRLYLTDLEWIILPEAHRDAEGYTFTNVSYYTGLDPPEALSQQFDGTSRAKMSIGLVRHMAGLAHAVWCELVPLMAEREAPAKVDESLDLQQLMTLDVSVDDAAFHNVIRRYPRLLGMNPDATEDGYETEYVVFADMLRFAWCHEWVHGLAGHTKLLQDRFGVVGLSDVGDGSETEDAAFVQRALEFEADAVSIHLLLQQILAGRDAPGTLVDLDTDLGGRLLLFLLGVSTLMTHWSERERGRPATDRRHPRPGLRFLRLWDMVRERLADLGQDAALAQVGASAQAIFRLADVCPAFVDLEVVTPVIVDTPTMERLRAEMLRYHELIVQMEPELVRFALDGTLVDAYPVRATD